MRSFAVLFLAIVALAFAAENTTETKASTASAISTSFSVTDTETQVITATQIKPITKTESAQTTFTTSYTVSDTETKVITTSQAVTSSQQQTSSVVVTTGVTDSVVVTSSTEATVVVTGTKTKVAPTGVPSTYPEPIPDISGKWETSDILCSTSVPVFDSFYDVSKVNESFYVFTPANPKQFSAGLVQEFSNGTFVSVSWTAACTGTSAGTTGSISCIVPTASIAIVCSAKLTYKSADVTKSASSSVSTSYSTSVGPTTTEVAYTDISGKWKVSQVSCANPAGYDSAYEVTKMNNTAYTFTPVDTKYKGGVVVENTASSFIGVSDAFTGCLGKITSGTTAQLSCLIEKATCTAVLTREADTTTSTFATGDTGAASTVALSFVLMAFIALF